MLVPVLAAPVLARWCSIAASRPGPGRAALASLVAGAVLQRASTRTADGCRTSCSEGVAEVAYSASSPLPALSCSARSRRPRSSARSASGGRACATRYVVFVTARRRCSAPSALIPRGRRAQRIRVDAVPMLLGEPDLHRRLVLHAVRAVHGVRVVRCDALLARLPQARAEARPLPHDEPHRARREPRRGARPATS